MTQADHLDCGDIIIITLPNHTPQGHEQQGTRPAIVVGIAEGEMRYPIIIIVPLTTQTGTWTTNNPTLYPQLGSGMGGLNQSSIALLDQVRAIDIKRILGYLGTLSAQQYAPIQQGLKSLFKI